MPGEDDEEAPDYNRQGEIAPAWKWAHADDYNEDGERIKDNGGPSEEVEELGFQITGGRLARPADGAEDDDRDE